MKIYNVGIIGFGFIGKVHAHGYLNLPLFYDPAPLEARITHVVTSRRETAEKARRTIGADAVATDFRAVTENPAIDIVHICTPNHLHKEALLSAIAHQKHVYCDKPLVATMAEAQEVRAALDDYRGVGQMTFQNRFFPATMRAKQLIDQVRLGKLLSFRFCYLHGGNADPATPLKWRLTAAAGGGVIADLASHVLDLADWLIGPFRSVMAATQIAYPTRPSLEEPVRQLPVDAEDSVLALARMQSGALGTIEATKIATGSEDEIRFEIHAPRRVAIQRHGPAPSGVSRRHGPGQAARRPTGLESDRRGPALSDAGGPVSDAQVGDRLASRPHRLFGQFLASGRRKPSRLAGPSAGDSHSAFDGLSASLGR